MKGSAGFDSALGIGVCWLAVHFSRMPVTYVQTYLDDSVGMNPTNVGRMGEILAFAQATKRFVIIGADFNVTPDELRLALDLNEAGLTIVAPNNSDITCIAGKGRLSSFFVVSTG